MLVLHTWGVIPKKKTMSKNSDIDMMEQTYKWNLNGYTGTITWSDDERRAPRIEWDDTPPEDWEAIEDELRAWNGVNYPK
jgi:hypothetical protein